MAHDPYIVLGDNQLKSLADFRDWSGVDQLSKILVAFLQCPDP